VLFKHMLFCVVQQLQYLMLRTAIKLV